MRQAAIIGVTLLLPASTVQAGMPSPEMLTDVARMRFEAISFFLVLIAACAGLVMVIWNRVLREVFVRLPRISYGKSLGLLVIWGLLLAVGSQLFLTWVFRESTGGRVWRFKWTAGLIAVVGLTFVAGSAAVGIVHQSAWLATSPGSLFKPRMDTERANRARCASNLHQIGLALTVYADDHGGRYPDQLVDLVETTQIGTGPFVCPSANAERAVGTPAEIRRGFDKHCTYVYLGRGIVGPVAASRMVVIEPVENHDDEGSHVLFGDGHVEWFDRPTIESLMATTRPTTRGDSTE